MIPSLRPYQSAIVNGIRKAAEKHKRIIAVAPTGSGKTIIAGHIAWKAVQKFDSSKSKLSTYVWNYIRWEIGRHFATLKKKNSRAKVYNATPELLNSLAYTRDEGDLWEIIPDSLNEQEKIVVYMKANGNTLSEISEKIERSINWTHIIFKKAVKKIQDAHEEKTNSTM